MSRIEVPGIQRDRLGAVKEIFEFEIGAGALAVEEGMGLVHEMNEKGSYKLELRIGAEVQSGLSEESYC
jgi:hypothetical protein